MEYVDCLVIELSQHTVASVADCQDLMVRGWRNRATGATLMNADSSRSHSIFSVTVEMMPLTESLEAGPIRRGKLSLVDLAGSERQAKTGESKMAMHAISSVPPFLS